jgi:serine/threonine protein kinase
MTQKDISKGAYGVLYLIEEKKTNRRYTMKILSAKNLPRNTISFEREIQILI